MIEVRNLVKKYGDHKAVDQLSFHVDKGQIYGFLGPNGAGKSTTMNIMTGYIASTEGEVIIAGHNILEEPEEAKKHIGYLPEQPPLYMDMTVEEYLKFVSELKKIPKAERKDQVENIMQMVGITDMKNRLIKNLSKGYKQRVGLAQAILGYPEIIILDEPTVGLDPKQIIEIRDLIKKLSENHTIILSSHILSEVSAVCDYVMIINHGKLVASDTTENLSKMTMGSNTLELEIKGKKEAIADILKQIGQIKEYEWKETQEYSEQQGEITALSITTEENIDIREEIFYKMAEAKLPILKMQSTKVSLEDIFLELTENEQEDRKSMQESLTDTEEKENTAENPNTEHAEEKRIEDNVFENVNMIEDEEAQEDNGSNI